MNQRNKLKNEQQFKTIDEKHGKKKLGKKEVMKMMSLLEWWSQ